jgi:hypothetical protein
VNGESSVNKLIATVVATIKTTLWGIVISLLVWQSNSPPALAAPVCRSIQDHDICILSIKRSAKNFWEYNAAVSIDGKRGPKEAYNCRSRYKTLRDGSIEYFDKSSLAAAKLQQKPLGEEIGSLVCKIYKPTRKGMPATITME